MKFFPWLRRALLPPYDRQLDGYGGDQQPPPPLPLPLAELSRRLLVLVASTPMPWLGLPFGVLLVMNMFHAGLLPLWGLWSDAGSAATWLLLLLLPQVRVCLPPPPHPPSHFFSLLPSR